MVVSTFFLPSCAEAYWEKTPRSTNKLAFARLMCIARILLFLFKQRLSCFFRLALLPLRTNTGPVLRINQRRVKPGVKKSRGHASQRALGNARRSFSKTLSRNFQLSRACANDFSFLDAKLRLQAKFHGPGLMLQFNLPVCGPLPESLGHLVTPKLPIESCSAALFQCSHTLRLHSD
jgi:hypothetical protein